MRRLDKKIALITGAAMGQGEAEARLFAAEGAQVILADVVHDQGRALAAELGERAEYVELDVRDWDAWQTLAKHVDDRYGRLDVLVNNAGIGIIGRLDTLPLEDHHRLFDINVHGVYYGMRAMLPLLKRSDAASIINISSIDGLVGVLGMSSYAATKFAVTGLTKSLAIELGDYGIRVNSIHPGVINSPMVERAGPEIHARLKVLLDRQPMKRAGTPQEVAKLALFLASEDSSYCTGSEFVIDGGHIAGPYRDPLP